MDHAPKGLHYTPFYYPIYKKKPSTKEECVVVIMFFLLNQRHRPRRGSNDYCTLALKYFFSDYPCELPLDLNQKGGKWFFGAKIFFEFFF